MNFCQRCRAQLGEFLDGTLSASARENVAAHLETCADCAREKRAVEATRAALRDLKPVAAPPELRLRVRAALQKEAQERQQQPTPQRPDWTSSFGFLRPKKFAWAGTITLSAIALLVLARPFQMSQAPNLATRSDAPTEMVPQDSESRSESRSEAVKQQPAPAAGGGVKAQTAAPKSSALQAASPGAGRAESPTSLSASKPKPARPAPSAEGQSGSTMSPTVQVAPPVTLPQRETEARSSNSHAPASASAERTPSGNASPKTKPSEAKQPSLKRSVAPGAATPNTATSMMRESAPAPSEISPPATFQAPSPTIMRSRSVEGSTPLGASPMIARAVTRGDSNSGFSMEITPAAPATAQHDAAVMSTRPENMYSSAARGGGDGVGGFGGNGGGNFARKGPGTVSKAVVPGTADANSTANDAAPRLFNRRPVPLPLPVPAPLPAPATEPDRVQALENTGRGSVKSNARNNGGGMAADSAPAPPVAPLNAAPLAIPESPKHFALSIKAPRTVSNAQIRLALPPALRFEAGDAGSSRVVWRGDFEAGKPVRIEFSLLGSNSGGKITISLEQNGAGAQSKPIETQTLALP